MLIVIDNNMATIIASTVPVSVLAVAVIISVVAIVWIGWKVSRLTGRLICILHDNQIFNEDEEKASIQSFKR